jgi:hypothetical protein
MRKIWSIAFIALLGVSGPALAQNRVEKAGHEVKQGTKKGAKAVKKGTKKTAHKTAAVASKGKAKVTNKKSTKWTGPEGQTIYIDNGAKYYWINGSGKRIYVSEAALKAKETSGN